MKSKSFRGMACSIAGALEAAGDRWAFLIMRDLSLGLARYDELKQSTGIPNTTLSERLKHLEQAGMVSSHAYQDNPPRYEYALTRKGREFGLVLLALAQWGDKWDAAETGAPPVSFVAGETGRRVKLSLVDAKSGEPVDVRRVEARAGPGADALVHWRLTRGRS